MKILMQNLLLPPTLVSAFFAPLSNLLAQGTAFTNQSQWTDNGAPDKTIETSDPGERLYR